MALKPKEQKVLDYVISNGPCTPTDVSKALGMDSIFSSAILASLYSNNYIKMSKMKYGSSKLYYYKGQGSKVREILYETLPPVQKRVIDKLRKSRILLDENITPQERLFLKESQDFVRYLEISFNGVEKKVWCYWDVTDDEVKRFFEKSINKERVTHKEKEVSKEHANEPKENFIMNVLNKFNFDIVKKKIMKKQAQLVVNMRNQLDTERVIIYIKEKANQNDLYKLYVKSLSKKMRIYLITKSKLKNKFGEFVKIISI